MFGRLLYGIIKLYGVYGVNNLNTPFNVTDTRGRRIRDYKKNVEQADWSVGDVVCEKEKSWYSEMQNIKPILWLEKKSSYYVVGCEEGCELE